MGQDNNGSAGLPIRGSGFNTDPQSADWDSLVYEGHNLNERVRGENTDTDDAFAIYVQGVSTTTKVFNVLKTGAIWTGSQNSAVLSATAGITLGAAAAAGSGAAALRYDATIRAFQATNPKPVGSVATYGSSSLASRDDHTHLGVASLDATGNAALVGAIDLVAGSGIILAQSGQGITITASVGAAISATAGVPSLFFGTQNVAGASGRYLDAASSIQIYDGTLPGSMTIGGAGTIGTSAIAPRRDHSHALTNVSVQLFSGSWGSAPVITNPSIFGGSWGSGPTITNPSMFGGSWGSGPILTNPQVAATGWASANHAHDAANTGGTIVAGALTLISSTLLSATAASIDFTSIPSTYTHLRLVVECRGGFAAAALGLVRVNNDANAIYHTHRIIGQDSTAPTSAQTTGGTAWTFPFMPGTNTTVTTYAADYDVIFMNYKNTNFFKSFLGVEHDSDDDLNRFTGTISGTWGTTAAINRITILPPSNNFITGTIASLYGIS